MSYAQYIQVCLNHQLSYRFKGQYYQLEINVDAYIDAQVIHILPWASIGTDGKKQA